MRMKMIFTLHEIRDSEELYKAVIKIHSLTLMSECKCGDFVLWT